MSRVLCAFLIPAVLLPSWAMAEVELGSWDSPYGTVTVEEDLATAKYPRHFIVLNALDGSSNANALALRCQNNKTEVYYVAPQFEFFAFGGSPDLNARFPSEDEAQRVRATNSSDSSAAFISSPIDFTARLAKEGQVVLTGSYYSGRFTGLFKTDDVILNGIHAMAETCGWQDRLPQREPVNPVPPSEASTSDAGPYSGVASGGPSSEVTLPANPELDLVATLKALVDQYGLPAVLKALGEL